MSIGDFLALIRRPTASEIATPASSKRKAPIEATDEQPATTVEELRAALARLDGESAAADQVVREAARKREGLLLEGTDDEIQALDLQTDRAHLQIERLARVRELLADRLRAIELDAARARWADLVNRYIDAGQHYSRLLGAAEIARAALHDIRMEASRSFREQTDAVMPYPIDLNRLGAAAVASVVDDIARSAPRLLGTTGPALANVRFTKWSMVGPSRQETAYQTGQEAGFPPAAAWRLIDDGLAEWAGPIPPRPGPPAPLPEHWIASFGEGAVTALMAATGRHEPE